MNSSMTRAVAAMLFLATGLLGCKDATLEPDLFGDVEGRVFDFETSQPLGGTSITTSPPTSALVSDGEGRFRIEDVPEGNYTITASRPDYATNSVTVSVRANRTTDATIFLEGEDEEEEEETAAMSIQISNWSSRVSNDSTFVNVEYRAQNTGDVDIPTYEIYFRIDTSGPSFFEEQGGTDLGAGQSDIGRFEKYIEQHQASDVVVDDFFFEGQD